jgi:hypothetical protein
MGNSKTWSSSRVNFRALAFHNIYIYIYNDLPPIIDTLSESILFADETNVIISSKNLNDFSTMSNTILSHMNKQFSTHKLVLNLDKTNTITFTTNKSPQYNLNIGKGKVKLSLCFN